MPAGVIVGVACPAVIREHLAASGATVTDLRRGDVTAPEPSGGELVVPRDIDPGDVVVLLGRLGVLEQVRGVVAVSDQHVEFAARLTGALGTPGPTARAVRLAADKVAMRKRLAEVGVSPVRWSPVSDVGDVVAFAERVGGPVVVKPAAGTGSRRIVKVDSPSSAALEEFAAHADAETGWIAEEFLVGTEVSVETFSWHGRHDVLGITAKRTGDHFVEMGHAFPADLPDDVSAAVSGVVTRTLTALGIDDAVSHTEVILTGTGPRLVETHPRVGGDRIGRLVELVTGAHPVARLGAALVGRAPAIEGQRAEAAVVRFFTVPPGVVTAVDGVEAAVAVDGVRDVTVSLQPGDRSGEVRSSDDRAGHVVATGDSVAAAERAALDALDRIRVTVDPSGAQQPQ